MGDTQAKGAAHALKPKSHLTNNSGVDPVSNSPVNHPRSMLSWRSIKVHPNCPNLGVCISQMDYGYVTIVSLWVEGQLTLDKMSRTYITLLKKFMMHMQQECWLKTGGGTSYNQRYTKGNNEWVTLLCNTFIMSSQSTYSLKFAMTCGDLVDMNLMSIINWLIHTLDLHTTVLRQWSRAWFHFVPIIMTLYLFLLIMS